MQAEMEQWEIDLRAKLQAELPDGGYDISAGDLRLFTGKGGKIEFEVELQREVRKFTHPSLEDNIVNKLLKLKTK